MVNRMESQGIVLAGIVLVFALYVLPYVYRRRRILSQTPLDDGQSQDLRILNLGDSQVLADEKYAESHDGVLSYRNEVEMVKSGVQETAVDIPALARERAKRRARVAKREANRTRGFVGAIVFGVLVAGLWIASATLAVPVAVPIVLTVLFACYAGGFVYLLSQMNTANAADLDAIEKVDSQMKSLRRSVSRQAQKRASSRAGRTGGRGTREEQTHGNGREKLLRDVRALPTAFLTKPVDEGVTILDSSASRPAESAEKEVSYSAALSVPSYTLKRAELVQREIAPYEPPAAPEAEVPYRPTKIGERLDVSEVTDALSGDDISSESLGGGALDDMLARRRA